MPGEAKPFKRFVCAVDEVHDHTKKRNFDRLELRFILNSKMTFPLC
jgi:hypothetical protein